MCRAFPDHIVQCHGDGRVTAVNNMMVKPMSYIDISDALFSMQSELWLSWDALRSSSSTIWRRWITRGYHVPIFSEHVRGNQHHITLVIWPISPMTCVSSARGSLTPSSEPELKRHEPPQLYSWYCNPPWNFLYRIENGGARKMVHFNPLT